MYKMNMAKCLLLSLQARFQSREQIVALQQRRFDDLIAYARTHSALFHDLYRDAGEHPQLADLPVTNKRDLMGDYDRWVTDPDISLERVNAFLKDEKNIGRILARKCRVSLTSGSTGTPCKVLNDKNMLSLDLALYFARTLPLGVVLRLGLRWGKILAISNPSFSMICNSIRAQEQYLFLNRYRCAMVPVDVSPERLIEKINTFKPAIVYTYPSLISLLIPLIKSGQMSGKPVLIILGGERCSPGLYKALQDSLPRTRILNTYGCSECGLMAVSCREGHLHVYSDWTIIEPVDQDNRPVPPGVRSDKALLTNLGNYCQPFIRYEIDDRIIWYDGFCPCGNVLPYIDVEGRIDDTLVLPSRNGTISVSPMTLAAPSELDGILKFQLVQKKPDRLELRLQVEPGYDLNERFEQARSMLNHAFEDLSIDDVEIRLADDLPQRHPVSGKFKMIIRQH